MSKRKVTIIAVSPDVVRMDGGTGIAIEYKRRGIFKSILQTLGLSWDSRGDLSHTGTTTVEMTDKQWDDFHRGNGR